MALDIWIGNPKKLTGRLALSFEPEAFYMFLFPLFESLAQNSGKMIDLYEDTEFKPTELGKVLALVDKAEALVSKQAKTFEVFMGTNMGSYREPKNEKILHSVDRGEYLKFIQKLRAAVLEAQHADTSLFFSGD